MSRSPRSTYDLVLLPGDGIGVEVIGHARQLLDVIARGTGCAFAIDEIPCGARFYLEHGSRDWPEGAEERCRAADAILLGAVGWNGPDGAPVTMRDASGEKMAGWSPVIGNRIRSTSTPTSGRSAACRARHGLSGRSARCGARDVDMVIVRENTEGCTPASPSAPPIAPPTCGDHAARPAGDPRAFELSRRRTGARGQEARDLHRQAQRAAGRRLFLTCSARSRAYPDVGRLAIVDSFAMFVLTQPGRYDVCVTTNMFGDILTDLASVLQGGMGMAVGCNVGDDHAMFEPIHGSAPPLVGKDRANPMAMLLATGEAMAWLGRRFSDDRLVRAHRAIEAAVAALVERGEPLTSDLGGGARGQWSAGATGSATGLGAR
jgi:3-isopropylmalate dehydrogenase